MSKVTELKERILTLEKASLEDVLGGSASYEALAAARQELVGGLKEPRELVDYLAQEIAEIDEELDSQRSPDPDRILAPKEIQALLGRQSELWERLQVAQRKAPFRFVLTTASQSDSFIRAMRPSLVIPALLTRISMDPASVVICLKADSTWPASATSNPMIAARPPAFSINFSVS